jgi:hypothetical protein
MLRARRSEADEIDDCVGLERCDARSKCPSGFLCGPIDLDTVHGIPCRIRDVWSALSTARDDYVVPRVDESRDEERPDVTGAADYYNSHLVTIVGESRSHRVVNRH